MRNLKHIFVALLLLFVGTTAMAQSQSDNTDGNTTTAVRADVNGDGVVNEADIAEILAIMKNAGGIAEQPKYYWYVGQENPANLDESFNPEGVEGWTKLDSTPKSIDISIKTSDGSKVQWYLACPSQYGFDTNVNGVKVGGWDITRNAVEIGGVKYDVWTCQATARAVNTSLAKV